MKKILTALLILALPATANALSLNEAVQIAPENNPSLQVPKLFERIKKLGINP